MHSDPLLLLHNRPHCQELRVTPLKTHRSHPFLGTTQHKIIVSTHLPGLKNNTGDSMDTCTGGFNSRLFLDDDDDDGGGGVSVVCVLFLAEKNETP